MTVETPNSLGLNAQPKHFIQNIVESDLASGKISKLVTRFPPEPNGFLHIGHAKSICLNFGIALQYNGDCHLRFDDTNPEKESQEFIDAIKSDVAWLGYQWQGDIRFASNYFPQIYQFACELIKKGKAYVCSLNSDEARQLRGTLKEPGQNSPFRDRSVEENLSLFEKMKQGDFEEGAHVLRAKIDMASPNINLRDPILYRIRHAVHHQSGDEWCIYPMYDFTHPISDAIEGVTYSLCTLEFEDHRPLYNWVLENIDIGCHPRQIEFSRLNINYTVTSKRKLKKLIDDGFVSGWDDPRMPTIAGLRRRGYTPESIRYFCEMVGVTKSEGVVDVAMLEHAIREDLNKRSPRAMCVLRPLKIEISNFPEGQTELLSTSVHPQNEEMGTRTLMMSKVLYIDEDDFAEVPPRKWKRLTQGVAVRLRGAYVITCDEVIKDDEGNVIELKCSYDAATKGEKPVGYKAKGVVHWVSADNSTPCEVREYDRLFTEENPDGDKERDFHEFINPESLVVVSGSRCEIGLADAAVESRYQFERTGYFCVDSDSTPEQLVFNRTVGLRDSWGK
jgi:glutaminyl-tRNA synthetase